MDIYPFIDSQAVREHLQKLNYRRNYVRIFNRAALDIVKEGGKQDNGRYHDPPRQQPDRRLLYGD